MVQSQIVTRFFILCLLFIIHAVAIPCQSVELSDLAGSGKELVWAQSDGLRHEIYSSFYRNNSWTAAVKVTDNNADNFHPVIDVAADGTKWLFWSAVRPDGISIEYARSQQGEWSEPLKFPVEQHSAITPSILVETTGDVWLVWAGNDGGNDEIYYSRYLKSSWSEPEILHAVNDVPDIKPDIAYNDQGKVEVSWLGFRDGQYKRLYVISNGSKGWSAEQEKEVIEEEIETEKVEVDLPDFLPENSQYFLKIY